MNRYILLGLLIMVSSFPDDQTDYMKIEGLAVTALDRIDQSFWCMGGIVSSKTVITSCLCVGSFPPPEYDYLAKNVQDLTIKTSKGKRFNLIKSFAHVLCRTTYWNYTVNDLGGWMIQGSFDERMEWALQPWHGSEECFVAEYRSRVTYIITMNDLSTCLDTYCRILLVLHSFTCGSFQSSVINDRIRCAYLSPRSLAKGSPILCKVASNSSDYVILGVVSFTAENVAFWTRVDLDENESFLVQIMRGGVGQADINTFLMAVILKHMIPIFQ